MRWHGSAVRCSRVPGKEYSWSIWSTPGASGTPLEYLEHPCSIWRKEQNTSQFEGVSLLFQGKEEVGNKRAVRELRGGNQENVVKETKVTKETFKKLEQPLVFPI